MSVTEIINHPRITQLAQRFPDKLRQDTIASSLPAMLGTATHDMFERYLRSYDVANPDTYLCERRMLTVVKCKSGRLKRIAGRFDMLERGKILWDVKQTSTFKFVKGNVDDFERQLNIYAHMLSLDGIYVDAVKILAVFPDWNKWERQRQGGTYPPNKITAYEMELWDPDQSKDYFEERVNVHDEASVLKTEDLPKCTDEDMWAQPTKWAVYKDAGSRRASKLCDSRAEAESFIKSMKGATSNTHIKKRLGTRTRCADWCRCAPVCDQYQTYLKNAP
jgi:hypothetical protein